MKKGSNFSNYTTCNDVLENSNGSLATGCHVSESKIIRNIKFDRYEIEIELTDTGVFRNILSIKVNKKFIESIKGSVNSEVHDVDKYYNEE